MNAEASLQVNSWMMNIKWVELKLHPYSSVSKNVASELILSEEVLEEIHK